MPSWPEGFANNAVGIEVLVLDILTSLSLVLRGEPTDDTKHAMMLQTFLSPFIPSLDPPKAPTTTKVRSLAMAYAVLEASHRSLTLGVSTTVRDLYYTNTALFESQAKTEKGIATITRWLASREGFSADEVPFTTREELGFGATARSVLMGQVRFTVPVGAQAIAITSTATDFSNLLSYSSQTKSEPTIVDASLNLSCGTAISTEMGRWASGFEFNPANLEIVVIEKECSLMTMVQREGALADEGRVLLCGKGYPCVASRALLKRMLEAAVGQRMTAMPSSPTPIHLSFLVDGDVDGILIMLTYLAALVGISAPPGRGTKRAREAVAAVGPDNPMPSISILKVLWLGLKPSTIPSLRDTIITSNTHTKQSGLPITFANDRALAKLQSIERAATSIVATCDAAMSVTNIDQPHYIIAHAVKDMLVSFLPPEVAYIHNTRMQGELQMVHSLAATLNSSTLAVLNCSSY